MSTTPGSTPTGTTDLIVLSVGQIYNVAATAADISWAGGDVALAQSLQLHLEEFIAAAARWSGSGSGDGTQATVAAALGAVGGFVDTFQATTGPQLQALGQQAAAGDAAAASRLGDILATLGQETGGLKQTIDGARAAALGQQGQFAQFAAAFAGDAQTAQTRVKADQAEQQLLAQQIADLQAKIASDQRYEELGWLAGPLGYLIARELGKLISGEDELAQQIQQLRAKAAQDQQEVITLGQVAGQTGTLVAAIDQLVIGLTSLADALAQLESTLTNLIQSLAATAPGPWLNPELQAIAATVADMGQQTATLAGRTAASQGAAR